MPKRERGSVMKPAKHHYTEESETREQYAEGAPLPAIHWPHSCPQHQCYE